VPQHAIQATCVYGLALVGGNIDSEADQEHAPAGKRKTSTGGSRSSWRDNRSLHEWVATSTDFPEARHGDTRSMMQRCRNVGGGAVTCTLQAVTELRKREDFELYNSGVRGALAGTGDVYERGWIFCSRAK
jgi:carbamoylphosphate synthase small subunit